MGNFFNHVVVTQPDFEINFFFCGDEFNYLGSRAGADGPPTTVRVRQERRVRGRQILLHSLSRVLERHERLCSQPRGVKTFQREFYLLLRPLPGDISNQNYS